MLSRLRKHATFSNVVAVLALFVALGGAAYAGTKISGKSIKNKSIAKKKLKANVLKGLDTCPSGATNYTNGICYGAQQAGNDWDVAARDCANKGLRLPDLGEGLLITNHTPLPFIWTTDVSDTGPPSTRVIVRTEDAGFTRIATIQKGGPVAYVCVLNATNPPA
ncbi:MAG TPA: hypothetical protein VH329_02745 [Solirubrobacterales bacterium]|jgi:hypothetical protein